MKILGLHDVDKLTVTPTPAMVGGLGLAAASVRIAHCTAPAAEVLTIYRLKGH